MLTESVNGTHVHLSPGCHQSGKRMDSDCTAISERERERERERDRLTTDTNYETTIILDLASQLYRKTQCRPHTNCLASTYIGTLCEGG